MASLLRTLLFLSFLSLAAARRRHLISFPSPKLHPSSLLYDPTSQHFLVGSTSLPIITSISDAGVTGTIIDDASNLAPGSQFPLMSLDNRRRRLLVVVTAKDSSFLAAYDLRSPLTFQRIFLSPLPCRPSAIVVDSTSGEAFIASGDENSIFKVDLEGNSSVFAAAGNDGIAGIATTKGYFLVISTRGKIFKVEEDGGKGREVIVAGDRGGAEAFLVARKDGSVAAASATKLELLVSGDGWGEAAVYEEVVIGDVRRRCVGAAVRERSVYVLMAEEGENGRIEEVEWRREEEGEWMVGMVLLGFGMAYFVYWRFQMGRLVGSMNKKRA